MESIIYNFIYILILLNFIYKNDYNSIVFILLLTPLLVLISKKYNLSVLLSIITTLIVNSLNKSTQEQFVSKKLKKALKKQKRKLKANIAKEQKVFRNAKKALKRKTHNIKLKKIIKKNKILKKIAKTIGVLKTKAEVNRTEHVLNQDNQLRTLRKNCSDKCNNHIVRNQMKVEEQNKNAISGSMSRTNDCNSYGSVCE